MYNSPYMPNSYSPQASLDRINNQMNELEKLKQQISQQIQQPVPNVTQNFQIAPTNRDVIKYAVSLDEVQRDMVIGETPYFSKDLSVVWIKNPNGNIRTFELTEIVPKDEKDMLITSLQMQIEQLRKEIKENAKPIDNNDDEPNKNEEPSNVSNAKTSTRKQK